MSKQASPSDIWNSIALKLNTLLKVIHFQLAATIEHAPLQSVYIYFDTDTYDEIERDVKVILHSKNQQLGYDLLVKCHTSRWQPKPNLVWLEGQWVSSLDSPYSVGLRSSTICSGSISHYCYVAIEIINLLSSGSSCLSGSPGLRWWLQSTTSLTTIWSTKHSLLSLQVWCWSLSNFFINLPLRLMFLRIHKLVSVAAKDLEITWWKNIKGRHKFPLYFGAIEA